MGKGNNEPKIQKRQIVWKFTNQRELTKKEFLNYFERKIFRTIRKYNMLPSTRIVNLKKSGSLNTAVLKSVLQTKFTVKFSNKPNFSDDNLSQIAEDSFKDILAGKFKSRMPKNEPLYFLSDKEVELYAKLVGIKGKKRKQNEKVQSLFSRFLKKNQDLEQNVIQAVGQVC